MSIACDVVARTGNPLSRQSTSGTLLFRWRRAVESMLLDLDYLDRVEWTEEEWEALVEQERDLAEAADLIRQGMARVRKAQDSVGTTRP